MQAVARIKEMSFADLLLITVELIMEKHMALMMS